MKRIYSILLFIVLAGVMVTSCNVEAKFSDYIPVHALQEMVKSATATCNGETVNATVDNSTHEIQCVFVNNSDFSDVTVKIEYSTRAIPKEGAFDEKTLDLTTPYTFSVNNQEEDFTYTITASRAFIVPIDRTQCSVIIGLENDAYDAGGTFPQNIKPEYLFDGRWMSKKEAWTEIEYHHWGWSNSDATQFNTRNSFTFDVGEPMKVSKMIAWPYWPYTNNTPALFEIYAWPLPGEPSGDWANWVKIAEVDDSWKWEIVKAATPGSADDLTQFGTTIEFSYGNVPEARYYRLKMIKNFYGYFGTALDINWSARVNWFTLAELQIWRYNLDE